MIFPSENIKKSFDITFFALVFSAIITFFLAFYFTNERVKTILSLETAVCMVASFFYYIFIQLINSEDNIDWRALTQIRYGDWILTTPIMLISLSLFLSFNSNTIVKFSTITYIIILNYIMLGFGYLGEMTFIPNTWAMFLGFIPFFMVFYLIYANYVKNSKMNMLLFSIYITIWALYGIVYLFREEQKNLITNLLDMMAKGAIGLIITAYFLIYKK